ncbi:MAG: hypothetical protein MUE40_09450 [Anaerolineae bacterium]|nr:hypothetical protein [Anaerolineae bacterium]
MSDAAAKKKQHTARELLAGGGILAAGLPFVSLAIIMGLVVIFAALWFTPPETRGAMLVVYVPLLLVMLFLLWRIIQRSAFLLHRLRGLRQEQRRAATLIDHDRERDTGRLELRETAAMSAAATPPAARQSRR